MSLAMMYTKHCQRTTFPNCPIDTWSSGHFSGDGRPLGEGPHRQLVEWSSQQRPNSGAEVDWLLTLDIPFFPYGRLINKNGSRRYFGFIRRLLLLFARGELTSQHDVNIYTHIYIRNRFLIRVNTWIYDGCLSFMAKNLESSQKSWTCVPVAIHCVSSFFGNIFLFCFTFFFSKSLSWMILT